MEAAESGKGDDLSVTNGTGLPWAARGCGLAKAKVGAVMMMIGHVVSQQAKAEAVVEDDDVVEKLAADAAHPSAAPSWQLQPPWGSRIPQSMRARPRVND
jgi:hypothetical protein